MRKILASLDIGSDSIKLVVGESLKGRIHILASSSVPSAGLKKGFIVDPNTVILRLQDVFQKCESMLGMKVSKVIVTVPCDGAEFLMTEGSSTITSEEHFVKKLDVIHAMQASTYNKIEEKREIVSIKPMSFILDEERPVKNPVGMEAIKVTVKSLVATVPSKNVSTIMKCLEKIGVEVVDFSLGAIGDYYEFQKNTIKDFVEAVINIGHNSTTVSIFNKGLLTNIETINVGGENIVNDVAYVFHLKKSDAKIVTHELASAHNRGASASVKKEFTTKDGESVTISEYEATEVASSRIEEILKLAKKEINLLTKKEIHYIMITGGVSEMTNFNILVEEVFGHSAFVGTTRCLGVRSNIYSSATGLMKYYDEKTRLSGQEFSIFSEDEEEELSNVSKKINFGENSILGKLFGYFFDN